MRIKKVGNTELKVENELRRNGSVANLVSEILDLVLAKDFGI